MLYTERVICIINIFETLKRVLAKSSNKEENPKKESINSNLKYNKISYVRITFIKTEMKEKAKEDLVRIFKDKEKIVLKILEFDDETTAKGKKIRAIKEITKEKLENIKVKKKTFQNMKKTNDFEKVLYANLLELEYLLLKKNNIIITKMLEGEKVERHIELDYKKNDEFEEIDDIISRDITYDRITFILKDDDEQIGNLGEGKVSETQIVNRIDIYARILENIIKETTSNLNRTRTNIGIIDKLKMLGNTENTSKKVAKLLEYVFSDNTKIINLSIKEKNQKILEMLNRKGKKKTEQELNKIKERYSKENEKIRRRITYWDVEKYKIYKKIIEKTK